MITFCFFLSSAILIGSVFLSLYIKGSHRVSKGFQPANILLVGVFISAVFLFLPIYAEMFPSNFGGGIQTLAVSFHHVLRLFVLDGEFEFISDYVKKLSGWLSYSFPLLAAALYVLAPMLTFRFILSFFKSLAAFRGYLFQYRRDGYIFSDLNERSLALARDLRKNHPKSMIVFTDVFEGQDDQSFELQKQARDIRAICFREEIGTIDFTRHSKKASLFFFLLSQNGHENITQSLSLIEKYRDRDNTRVYTFSTNVESELLVRQPKGARIKVHRVNQVRTLILRMLYDRGQFLFEDALPDNNGVKTISVAIVGLGKHGTEMLRTLPWLCQMNGYRLVIHAFGSDPLAESKFRKLCPELMAPDKNGVHIDGEAEYEIHIHSGISIETTEFSEILRQVPPLTYVFISLGNDDNNIETAVSLRILSEQLGIHPRIQSVVYSTQKCRALNGVTNFKGQPYRIEFLGDMESEYAEKVVLHSAMEQDALLRHMKWGAEEDFWRYEYNYRSSIATAIHMRMREACHMPGAGKTEDQLTDDERAALELLEHKRWNAYMRCDGYIYSGSLDSSSRNDLGKMHQNLVPFALLNEDDKRKDSRVGSK
ncbi:MAG: hypothetical protein II458_00430 [Oscillospiraceae bacterium]|nr:hypothetical protein [Oscillospiraceae bacterium]